MDDGTNIRSVAMQRARVSLELRGATPLMATWKRRPLFQIRNRIFRTTTCAAHNAH